MSNILSIHTIMVPQGAEYKAVCRGLSRISTKTPMVLPIPVGVQPLTKYLQQLPKNEYFLNISQPRVLVMGLCGSLTKKYTVGDIVLYQDCIYQDNLQKCDRSLTTEIHSALSTQHSALKTQHSKLSTQHSALKTQHSKLSTQHSALSTQNSALKTQHSALSTQNSALSTQHSALSTQHSALNLVRGLTSDRVIWSAKEKRDLGETSGADVVDMEGFAALNFFSQNGVAVAMLRVVSDNCEHDIPDLTTAFNSDGSLQPIPLALGLLRQPVAATRLIRGSLRGLKVLEQVTKSLFSNFS